MSELRPAQILGGLLREKGLTLSAAESCTGGLLSSTITDITGSSDYFMGGIVAYANDVKKKALGVKVGTLKAYGAVSRKTAAEMAVGVKKALSSDIGVGITGIAGPGGGTMKKPVGLVFIGIAIKKKATVKRFLFKGSRKAVKRQSAEAALAMIIDSLNKLR